MAYSDAATISFVLKSLCPAQSQISRSCVVKPAKPSSKRADDTRVCGIRQDRVTNTLSFKKKSVQNTSQTVRTRAKRRIHHVIVRKSDYPSLTKTSFNE